jgi:predicted MFS family arabinose efflux permease
MISNWWVPNIIGRLRTIQIGCLISIVGATMQTAAPNYSVLLTGRIIGGVASGIIFSICPTYAAEISAPSIRGRVGGLYG